MGPLMLTFIQMVLLSGFADISVHGSNDTEPAVALRGSRQSKTGPEQYSLQGSEAQSNSTLKQDDPQDGDNRNESLAASIATFEQGHQEEMEELSRPGHGCCRKCAGHFCSPNSGLCHRTHAKPHYLWCGAHHGDHRPQHAHDNHRRRHHGAPGHGPVYVPVPYPVPQAPKTTPTPQLVSIRCADGTNVWCPYGTMHCTYNSEVYCAGHRIATTLPTTTPSPPAWPGMPGSPQIIKCLDGRTVQCSRGTEGCSPFSSTGPCAWR